MASIKNLKKDINYLVDEVIGICLLHQYTRGPESQDELENIIKELVEYRDELINKVNNPDVKDGKKKLKTYYRSLFNELLEKVNKAFETLNTVSQ
jgi:hypothetical protein